MLESTIPSGVGTHEGADPVVVFRSSDPIECASIASALSDVGVQAWVHDDPAFQTVYGSGLLEVSVGRPSCVSVPAPSREHALGIVSGLDPRADRVQNRESSYPIQGLGYQVPSRGRVNASLIVAAFVVGLIVSGIRLWRGQPF
jgi:hypothetical protein